MKAELDKKADYEKKYTQILTKARQLQLEKSKLMKQIQDHKATTPAVATANAEPSTAANSQESAAKISELEKTLASVRKELSEKNIELTRLRAQFSMSQGKTNRLQKELDALKVAAAAAAATTTSTAPATKPTELSAAAPEFKATSPNQIRTSSAPPSPAITQKTTTITGLLKKAVASAVHTPGLSSAAGPVDASPLTTPSAVTPQDTTVTADDTEEAVATPIAEEVSVETEVATTPATTEIEVEPIITTPAQVDTEITEVEELAETTHTSQETGSPDTDLLMEHDHVKQVEEEEVAASEELAVTEEVTVTSTADDTEEVPAEEVEEVEEEEGAAVEVEVHELETEKIESPTAAAAATASTAAVEEDVAVDSPVVFNEETTEEVVEAELGEVVAGTKRDREEDGEVSDAQSPSKKSHTNNE